MENTAPHTTARRSALRRPGAKTDSERCRALVERIAEATGEEWTFGYLGNVTPAGDERSWYAFRPHPGRVGTYEDRIGGQATADVGELVTVLGGALAMARMLAR